MDKLYLKFKNSWYCYKDNYTYEFKETTCGRYFVWKSKFKKGDKEIEFQMRNEKEQEKLSHEKYYEQLEKNRKMGTCFEVGKKSYKSLLEEEKESKTFLAPNLKYLGPNGENPEKAQIYEGSPEDNAKKYYDKGKYPHCWSYVIGQNNYGQLYITDMISKSDHFFDGKGKEIVYDRAFFDSINNNVSKAKRVIEEIKELLESRKEKGVMSIYEELKGYTDVVSLNKKLTSLKLEFYFADNAKRMEKELKKLVPRNRDSIKSGIKYTVGFDTSSFKTEYSAYSTSY